MYAIFGVTKLNAFSNAHAKPIVMEGMIFTGPVRANWLEPGRALT